jgi:hypothetical protein
MPRSCILPFVLFPVLLFSQVPLALVDEGDVRDDALLRTTLSVSISPEDIHSSEFAQDLAEKQADEMTAASQRRIQRQELRIQQLQGDIASGKAKAEDLTPMLDEMHLRIETGRIVVSRATVVKEIVRSARQQQAMAAALKRGRTMEKYSGNGMFSTTDLAVVEKAFVRRFGRPLPISADGDTSLHRALGLDHSGRVDVAVSPDQQEGVWLRNYLETLRIPYYAFRKAVIGSATAPHIHIGPPSIRHISGQTRPSKVKRSAVTSSAFSGVLYLPS